MPVKKTGYTNESIKQLKGADRVRLRPSVIFGSDGVEGCQHSIFEIISNSIDEAREGHGKLVRVIRHADDAITVIDRARGVPVDYNPAEDRFNWELIYCELYAGGKYENADGENYQYSLGLNGLGACATQYASEYMRVESRRDGYKYALSFIKGQNIGGLVKTPYDKKDTGTITSWKPDLEVFTDINVPQSYFTDTLKRQAIVNSGITFEFTDEKTGEDFTYLYPEGIVGYVKEMAGENPLTQVCSMAFETRGRDRADKQEYNLKAELAFCFSNDVNQIEYYHNSSFLEYGGSPDKAVKAAFLAAVDNLLKNNNLYKKDEKKLTFADIEDSLILVSSSFSNITSYENQTKKAINNRFIQEALTEFLKKQLEVYFIENKAAADKIAAQMLINKRSRETAEKTRVNLKKQLSSGVDFANRVEKFVNCRTKDINRREIYIVEGDSALTSCKLGRDAEFQAVLPVRGKPLNCLKADINKIFANEIITDLIRVLGCGVEVKAKGAKDLNSFDLDKLNWNRVIICTDADVDGFQIRALILTMIYRLMPQLIPAGKVFIAESPLYEITSGKNTYFAYSDKERDQVIKKLSGKVNIQRSKGLGENEPEMMWRTTMNPETRRLILVRPTDAVKTQEMFDVLLGDNMRGRKAFIEENGHRYVEWGLEN
ncbi:MAG: toprim domain-containing protein [Defluviitaleaceae bacterium]|nr:toprim domain-containing protein [Defluviitaleaceae bacterium]MCL2835691.1 toprim domain-containing protein [Defluviitaleaceae bacterium]